MRVRFVAVPDLQLAEMLGGSRRSVSRFGLWSNSAARTLAKTVVASADKTWSVVVCASRQTPSSFTATFHRYLRSHFGPSRMLVLSSGLRLEPYSALKHCDAILVTSDSVDLVSEAFTSGRSVYVDDAPVFSRRLRRLRKRLVREGLAIC